MKTRLLLCFLLLSFAVFSGIAQVPQGFNYQAVARDGSGNPITNTTLQVKIAILSDTTGFYANGTGTYIWEEQHSVTTNSFGIFTLAIGTGTKIQGSAATFSVIPWTTPELFIGTKINYPTWKQLGSARLWSVPYAMVSEKANGVNEGAKLSVKSDNDLGTDALFEVRRQDGQTVFAVYPDAVNVYVPRSGGKGAKGGFAIGGFDGSKADPQDYFRVTPDSVRIYIDPTPNVKGAKGGFAIGGYGGEKGISDMYFNLTGASTVNTVKASPQILWYPTKNAFLAGNVHIGAVDSVGDYSTALGYQSVAMGDYSQAFGYKTMALGDYSTAIGKRSVAGARSKDGLTSIASSAFALGNGSKALGDDSYAFGSGAQATGASSFAFGSVSIDSMGHATTNPTLASGDYSAAIGMGAQAKNFGAMAFGASSISTGYASTSIGFYSSATNYYGVAIGYYSQSTGYYGHAFGLKAIAGGTGSLALGMYARATANYATSLGYYSNAMNQYSIALGSYAKTGADYASALGRNATANGTSSVAVGYAAQTASTATDASAFGRNAAANAPSSVALGSGATTAAGASYSTALGYGSSATGEYATALGYNVQANGAKAISIGAYYDYTYFRLVWDSDLQKFTIVPVYVTKNNIASGDYSIALGNGNTVSNGGLAIGSNNTASKMGSVALGHTNSADSAYSFAAGANNYARGYNAFALGESVIAEAANSFVIGYNNIISSSYDRDGWINTDPLFVIGNGGSGSRSNAMVVAKNGNTTINGNLTVTGTISSFVGTGDGLGNHTATQNLRMSGYYISNDGGNEGIYINPGGDTYIYGTQYIMGRGEVTNSTEATGAAGSGGFEVANSLRLDGDEIITNSGTTLLINNDNTSNVQVDGGTLFVDATNNRIGINNTAPSYGLDVTGTMRASSTSRFGADVYLESASPAFYFTDNTLDQDDFKFEANADVLAVTTQGKVPVTVLQMSSSGPVAMPSLKAATGLALYINSTTGEITKATSSARYKNTIEPLGDISWLYNLRPVSFLYNGDITNSVQYGLIAEEVEKVNKSLVVYDKDGKPDGVLYNNLISTLVKATRDQKEIIASLKADNDNLKQRLEKLEKAVSAILATKK